MARLETAAPHQCLPSAPAAHQRLPSRGALSDAVRHLGAGASRLHLLGDRRLHRAADRGDARRRGRRPRRAIRAARPVGPRPGHRRAQRRRARRRHDLSHRRPAGPSARRQSVVLAKHARDPARLDRLSQRDRARHHARDAPRARDDLHDSRRLSPAGRCSRSASVSPAASSSAATCCAASRR